MRHIEDKKAKKQKSSAVRILEWLNEQKAVRATFGANGCGTVSPEDPRLFSAVYRLRGPCGDFVAPSEAFVIGWQLAENVRIQCHLGRCTKIDLWHEGTKVRPMDVLEKLFRSYVKGAIGLPAGAKVELSVRYELDFLRVGNLAREMTLQERVTDIFGGPEHGRMGEKLKGGLFSMATGVFWLRVRRAVWADLRTAVLKVFLPLADSVRRSLVPVRSRRHRLMDFSEALAYPGVVGVPLDVIMAYLLPNWWFLRLDGFVMAYEEIEEEKLEAQFNAMQVVHNANKQKRVLRGMMDWLRMEEEPEVVRLRNGEERLRLPWNYVVPRTISQASLEAVRGDGSRSPLQFEPVVTPEKGLGRNR